MSSKLSETSQIGSYMSNDKERLKALGTRLRHTAAAIATQVNGSHHEVENPFGLLRIVEAPSYRVILTGVLNGEDDIVFAGYQPNGGQVDERGYVLFEEDPHLAAQRVFEFVERIRLGNS